MRHAAILWVLAWIMVGLVTFVIWNMSASIAYNRSLIDAQSTRISYLECEQGINCQRALP